MRHFRRALVLLGGASLAVSPAAAAPIERNSKTAEEVNSIGSGDWIGIVGALLVVALAAVAAFGDDDAPVSP